MFAFQAFLAHFTHLAVSPSVSLMNPPRPTYHVQPLYSMIKIILSLEQPGTWKNTTIKTKKHY